MQIYCYLHATLCTFGYPWRPEEDVKPSGAGVTGAGNWRASGHQEELFEAPDPGASYILKCLFYICALLCLLLPKKKE